MPRLSVIIPCYNDAKYLAEAIDSVLGQSLAPDEIIVVDDGSTDGSGDIARGYGERVQVLVQENGGIGSARNRGLAVASGEWIAFLDADDIWPEDSLALRMAALQAQPGRKAVVGLTEQFITPDIDPQLAATLHCPEGRIAVRFAGAMIIAKESLDRAGGFDETLHVGEMFDLAARLQDEDGGIGAVDELVMRRRIHGDNTVLRNRDAQRDYLRALKAVIDRRKAKGGADAARLG